MLFTFLSIVLFSSLMAASLLVFGVAAVPVPSDPAEPVVTPAPVLAPPSDDCAVPELLVPGAGGEASLDVFPAPLGSSPALFDPPGLAGPGGTPLMPEVPAPAEPALGEPAALPPDGPPPLCANDVTGDVRIAMAAMAMIEDAIFLKIPFWNQRQRVVVVPAEQFPL